MCQLGPLMDLRVIFRGERFGSFIGRLVFFPSGGGPFILHPDTIHQRSPSERREMFQRQGTN